MNAIDVYGLIDNTTPLHIRILLCMIAIEGLLSSHGEKDYLSWKLSEKVAFLLGDSPAVIVKLFDIADQDISTTLTDEFICKKKAQARLRLARQMKRFYAKRSEFVHGGLETESSKIITIDDYNFTSSILRWAIEKLLELCRNGISRVEARNKDKIYNEDISSLEYYIDKLKFS